METGVKSDLTLDSLCCPLGHRLTAFNATHFKYFQPRCGHCTGLVPKGPLAKYYRCSVCAAYVCTGCRHVAKAVKTTSPSLRSTSPLSVVEEALHSFEGMPLPEHFLSAIFKRGKDVVVQGTLPETDDGLVVGTLHRVDTAKPQCQAMILSSTRDRAGQTREVLNQHGLNEGCCHLFQNLQCDVERLKQGRVTVAVGTPGRICDAMKGGHLATCDLQIVVLDHVDEMLSQGFAKHLETIFATIPTHVQVVMFSPTMPEIVEGLSRRLQRDPERIVVREDRVVVPRTLTLDDRFRRGLLTLGGSASVHDNGDSYTITREPFDRSTDDVATASAFAHSGLFPYLEKVLDPAIPTGSKIVAVLRVLLHGLKLPVYGGVIRDFLLRGEDPSDIDVELPAVGPRPSKDPAAYRTLAAGVERMFRQNSMPCQNVPQKHGVALRVKIALDDVKSVVVEFVDPRDITGMTGMDLSCNNLMIQGYTSDNDPNWAVRLGRKMTQSNAALPYPSLADTVWDVLMKRGTVLNDTNEGYHVRRRQKFHNRGWCLVGCDSETMLRPDVVGAETR